MMMKTMMTNSSTVPKTPHRLEKMELKQHLKPRIIRSVWFDVKSHPEKH